MEILKNLVYLFLCLIGVSIVIDAFLWTVNWLLDIRDRRSWFRRISMLFFFVLWLWIEYAIVLQPKVWGEKYEETINFFGFLFYFVFPILVFLYLLWEELGEEERWWVVFLREIRTERKYNREVREYFRAGKEIAKKEKEEAANKAKKEKDEAANKPKKEKDEAANKPKKEKDEA